MAKKAGMRLGHKTWLPVVFFAAGVALVLAAVSAGTADVSLLILFPVFTGSSPLFFTGVLFIMLSFLVGFALIMMGQLEAERHIEDLPEIVEAEIHGDSIPESHKSRPGFGGLILVGPIPIAFGSDRAIAIFMLVAGVVLVTAFIVGVLLFG